jgi:hypothetical protein
MANIFYINYDKANEFEPYYWSFERNEDELCRSRNFSSEEEARAAIRILKQYLNKYSPIKVRGEQDESS